MADPKILGWSMGQDRRRYYDETGVFHLIAIDDGAVQTRNACGSGVHTSGQLEDGSRGHKCKKCHLYYAGRERDSRIEYLRKHLRGE
jgi:hypothetical protein